MHRLGLMVPKRPEEQYNKLQPEKLSLSYLENIFCNSSTCSVKFPNTIAFSHLPDPQLRSIWTSTDQHTHQLVDIMPLANIPLVINFLINFLVKCPSYLHGANPILRI